MSCLKVFLIGFSFPGLNGSASKFFTRNTSFLKQRKKEQLEQSPFNLKLAESFLALVLFQLVRGNCCHKPINQQNPQKTTFTIGLCAHENFSMAAQAIYTLPLVLLDSKVSCHVMLPSQKSPLQLTKINETTQGKIHLSYCWSSKDQASLLRKKSLSLQPSYSFSKENSCHLTSIQTDMPSGQASLSPLTV